MTKVETYMKQLVRLIMPDYTSQYEEVCHMAESNGCETILDINEHIHIWKTEKFKLIGAHELTICESCHQDYYDDLKSKGYSHDEEENDA